MDANFWEALRKNLERKKLGVSIQDPKSHGKKLQRTHITGIGADGGVYLDVNIADNYVSVALRVVNSQVMNKSEMLANLHFIHDSYPQIKEIFSDAIYNCEFERWNDSTPKKNSFQDLVIVKSNFDFTNTDKSVELVANIITNYVDVVSKFIKNRNLIQNVIKVESYHQVDDPSNPDVTIKLEQDKHNSENIFPHYIPYTIDDIELGRISEEIRTRKAIAEKSVHPRQAPIQNALIKQLFNFFSPKGGIVTWEDGRVDIKLVAPDGSITFIEIKPASSAREAMRLAIGQLLEYSHYPNTSKADRLVIVSDAEPHINDIEYISHLKNLYNLPVRYIYWPHDTKELPVDKLADFI